MEPANSALSLPEARTFGQIGALLASRGWCCIPDAVPESICSRLFQQVLEMDSRQFEPAGIGRQQQRRLNDLIRRDLIHWIYGQTAVETDWLAWMENLRLYLNEHLFLGLSGFESHFSHYLAEGFYRRHVDAFKGDTNRILSTVLFLNPAWRAEDGGALVLYQPDAFSIQKVSGQNVPAQENPEIARFLPVSGSLVVFLSEEFPHEVQPAERDRYSVAGWFRSSTA